MYTVTIALYVVKCDSYTYRQPYDNTPSVCCSVPLTPSCVD